MFAFIADPLKAGSFLKETSISMAKQALDDYAAKSRVFYAPGVIVAEVLFVLCRKLSDGTLTAIAYNEGVEMLKDQMAVIFRVCSARRRTPPVGQWIISKGSVVGGDGSLRVADVTRLISEATENPLLQEQKTQENRDFAWQSEQMPQMRRLRRVGRKLCCATISSCLFSISSL